MKKLVLTLIVSFALLGSAFAQYNSDIYESYWIDQLNVHVYNPYEYPDCIVPFAQIDGEFVTYDMDYEAMEIGVFDESGTCRGHSFLVDDGEDYPITEISVYRMLAGDNDHLLSFMMYDHANGILYTECTPNNDYYTGYDYVEIYMGDLDNAPILNFATPVVASYEKFIEGYGESAGGYYLIATPVADADPTAVTGMTTGNYDLYAFDQTQDLEWRNYKEDLFNLEFGKGYLYAHGTDVTLEFSGTTYDGDGEFDLVYDDAVDFKGWNLVGNPYLETAYINREHYVMNVETGRGEFIAVDATEGIPEMEGAFVIAEGEGETVTFSTTAPGKASMLALNVTQGRGVIDRAIVGFGDGHKLPKLQLNPNSTKLSIQQDNEEFAVIYGDAQAEMPLNFKAEKNGSYDITLNLQDADLDYLHLIDNMTGADIDLLETPSYKFEATTSDYASRFKLIYVRNTTGVNEHFAFISDNGILLNGVNGNSIVNVFDAMGRLVSSSNGVNHIATENLSAGVYMIQLVNGENTMTQKIVVK